MKTSEALRKAMNSQVGNEMGASMQYISIAHYFDSVDLPELAQFFFNQAEEEREHAMKFVDYLGDVGAPLEIPAIPAPKATFENAEEAVQLSLDWEQEVTQQIYDLVDIAKEDKDYMAQRFLDWFVEEQREEVSTMGTLLGMVRRAG